MKVTVKVAYCGKSIVSVLLLSTEYLRVCLFCLWPRLLLNAASYTAKFCTQTRTDHVHNICWVLCLKGSLLRKNDIFKKYLHVRQQLRSRDGSVGWLGRLAVAKACTINSVTINSTGVGCVRGPLAGWP